MFGQLLTKIVGTQNDRELKRLRPRVGEINAFEDRIKVLTEEQLRSKTTEFRTRLANGETLDDLLPEAFAVVREAGRRVLQMRHYDVQLIGGMVLHNGTLAEMKTGEGKTLVATLPAYLNALGGKGVHIVTVNDYLARRDSEWMGRVYRYLGMSVGVIQHDLNDQQRQVAYACDITYGTNNEFGFDYLRDNMKFDLSAMVQRGHQFAIVDEVDSILIDEARTPLIISGPAEESTDLYYEVDRIIPKLTRGEVHQGQVKGEDRDRLEASGDFVVDEKNKTATLTEAGMGKAEQLLAHRLQPGGLYDPANMPLLHHVQQALRAHVHYQLDVQYMIKDGQVVIVDEFTGRLMPGRRWSDGLHQAVEAKEGVKIERENQTLATITFQNYFRKYKKLSGMTGTAETEAAEFAKIYNLDVIVIPTNRPMVRLEEPDLVYRTEAEKWAAIVDDIIKTTELGRPGAGRHGLDRKVRARLEHAEAEGHQAHRAQREVPRAGSGNRRAGGRKGGVTIATNMAGRGTDILLGGNPEYMARQQSLNEGVAETCAQGRREVRRRRRVRELLPRRRVLPREARRLGPHLHPLQEPDRRGAQGSRQPRRPAHHRHRAPRGAAHRQPAARPRRTPGRPGLVAVLPVARGRSDAHLRVGSHLRPDAAPRHGRRRADRARHGHARHRARAEAGGSAELRGPQTPARIRRRDEQAARARLHAAPRDPRRQDPSPRRGRGGCARLPARHRRGSVRRTHRAVRRQGRRGRGLGHSGARPRAPADVRA